MPPDDRSALTYGQGPPFLGGVRSEEARARWDLIFPPKPKNTKQPDEEVEKTNG